MLNRFLVWAFMLTMGFCSLACSDKITTRTLVSDDIQRVLFLGNSITYSGQYIEAIETYYRIKHPELTVEWINLGLPSETVSGLSEEGHADGAFPRPDLHERLQRILTQVKPDLVFANYGMNDRIYMPLDADRFERFKSGMNRLHDAVVATGAKVVHLTPPVYDDSKGQKAGYDEVLYEYSSWLLDQRRENKWKVLDIHGPMKAYLEKKRRDDPSFYLAADGVHPGDEGHWLIAKEILLFLGEKGFSMTEGIDQVLSEELNSDKLIGLVRERQQLMRDSWLTATQHQRPGINVGLPLEIAREKAQALDGRIINLAQSKKK